MCRCTTCSSIMLQHMDWRDDCLVVTVPKAKNDQLGENQSREKHIYANPLIPEISAILALAVLFFSQERNRNDPRQQLFIGIADDARFFRILQSILSRIPDDVNLGANKKDIGTHSNRKGSSTYCLLWPTVSAVQVYLRAGWSLGNVQDRYIIAGAGADQLVGRVVCGLPVNSNEIGTLPPHFNEVALNRLANIGWNAILPGYDLFPGGLKRAVPFLFASLVYHIEWLEQKLSPLHPLWQHPVFTQLRGLDNENISLVISLRQFVSTGIGRCPITNMVASGIPYHLAIANEVRQNTEELRMLRQAQENNKLEIIQHLNDKAERVLEAVATIPTEVRNVIMDNFEVNGAVPLRPQDIVRAVESLEQRLMMHMEGIVNDLRNNGVAAPPRNDDVAPAEPPNEVREDQPFQNFIWGNAIRFVPADFIFPSTTVKRLWFLWYYGDRNTRIRPYRYLAQGHTDDLRTLKERVLLSKTKAVMEGLEEILFRSGKVGLRRAHHIMNLTLNESSTLFDEAFDVLLHQLYGNQIPSRPLDLILSTVANRMSKRRRVAGNGDNRDEENRRDGIVDGNDDRAEV